MDIPLVSVIMLTYNHKPFVKQAIESVLMQKVNFNYELLIGDDCSTDGTIDILQEYANLYPNQVKLFLSEENQGITKNSYRLYKKALGKYLASCEGDDYWVDENKLQIQVDFLENNPQYIGCSHAVFLVDNDGNLLKSQKLDWVFSRNIYTLDNFNGIILPGHSSSIVRKNIFLDQKYDYSIIWKLDKYIGDRTGALIWAAQGNFFQFPTPMACYRVRRGGNFQNVTAMLYSNNENKYKRELDYTCRLEEYSITVLKKFVNFDYYKRRLCVGAIKDFMTRPSKSRLRIVIQIIRSMKAPVWGILCIPIIIIKKLGRRLVNIIQ